MRVLRAGFYILMAGFLLTGLYTGERLCFLLFFMLFFTLLCALGLNLWTLFSLAFSQELSAKEAEKGGKVNLRLEITNDKPFPFTHMKVRVDMIEPSENTELGLELEPMEKAVFNLPVNLPRRGEFTVGMGKLYVTDIFGLIKMHLNLENLSYYRKRQVLVLPRLRELKLPPLYESPVVRGAGRGIPRGREELSFLRDYVPGDQLSKIHWKASAKMGRLATKEFEDPLGGGCLVFLDTRVCGDGAADELTETALALVRAYFLRSGGVRLVAAQRENMPVPEADRRNAFLELRRFLAVLPFDFPEEDSVPAALDAAIGSETPGIVYILGNAFDPYLVSVLARRELKGIYLTKEPLPEGTPKLFDGVSVGAFEEKDPLTVLSDLMEGGI